MAVSRRRVIREPSVKSSVLSNESYFERVLIMANHLSSYQRERIASLSEEGKNISQIVTILESEGRKTSRTTVRKWVYRWETNRGLHDQHRSGRPSKITSEMAAFMEAKLEEDDEIYVCRAT